ncbi:MAG: nucleoside monophosphate kinase [Hyphomonadaceae bacterium]
MNLILFGPPGAGKGTQSTLLVERMKMKQISTGDLFRAAIKTGTALGKEAKSILDAGKLVPDSVTIGLVDEVLGQLKGQGFILDGFPRNVVQADALEKILKRLNLTMDKAVFLEVPLNKLLGRLTGRRVCKNCGTVYHIDSKPHESGRMSAMCARLDRFCNVRMTRKTSSALGSRPTRQSTSPLKDYYKAKGPYVEIDGLGTSEDVYARLMKAVQVTSEYLESARQLKTWVLASALAFSL